MGPEPVVQLIRSAQDSVAGVQPGADLNALDGGLLRDPDGCREAEQKIPLRPPPDPPARRQPDNEGPGRASDLGPLDPHL